MDCRKCKYKRDAGPFGGTWCNGKHREIDNTNGRPDWCPLLEKLEKISTISTADLVCLQCGGGLDMTWKYCPLCGWRMGTMVRFGNLDWPEPNQPHACTRIFPDGDCLAGEICPGCLDPPERFGDKNGHVWVRNFDPPMTCTTAYSRCIWCGTLSDEPEYYKPCSGKGNKK